jgi:membrane-bound ClpP family serine protease
LNEAMLLWGFGLFALAALLLVLELFIPSGGLLGGMAALSGIAGVIAFFQHSTTWGLTSLAALMILSPVAVWMMFKIWPYTPVGKAMILGSPGTEGAEHARADAERREQERAAMAALIGKQGSALTDCRPVGQVEIEGERHEGLAQGSVVERGDRVKVTGVDGMSLKVRRVS